MTGSATAAAPSTSGSLPGMRSEIAQKWPKFTEAEVTALKSKDDLVAQVQSKYTLERSQAQKDVDDFARGRAL